MSINIVIYMWESIVASLPLQSHQGAGALILYCKLNEMNLINKYK